MCIRDRKGINEGNVNTYITDINAQNARRNQNMGMGASLLGALIGG